jgi:hypothetical protein
MSKGIYVGVGGAVRKAKPYVGVGGVVKKVKKGYCFTTNQARLIYNMGLEKINTVISLGSAKGKMGVAALPNIVMYGGSNYNRNIDAFDSNLIRYTSTMFARDRSDRYGAAAIGCYGLFAGGSSSSGQYWYDGEVYNSNLVLNSYLDLGGYATANPAMASITNYAILAGGWNSSSYNTKVWAWDANLNRLSPSDLTKPGDICGYVSWTNRVILFFSGQPECYDINLQKSFILPLSGTGIIFRLTIAQNNKYLLVYYQSGSGNDATFAIDVYDKNLTKVGTAMQPRCVGPYLGAGSTPDFAVFAGGYKYYWTDPNDIDQASVDIYDTNLVSSPSDSLSLARSFPCGSILKDNLIFAGGLNAKAENPTTTVDVYKF